jgi:phosphopantothenoylcysteine decarboxylase / phosphopantothenate---cysteine ligase
VTLDGKRILVGLSGGIACYKACDLVRQLRALGATVQVVMTKNAREFVTPMTLQALAGSPVATDTFDLTQESEIGHIRLADDADVVVIAPATANVIAKMAHGIADDLLMTVLLATRAPVVVAPAMNVHMWEHAATQENVRTLASRGVRLVGPASGSLACGYEGAGRLAEVGEIVEAAVTAVTPQDLVGEHVLVSAGPTREAIDPVRYLTNHSSGKMGFALARVARRRGAEVTLVAGPIALAPPPGVRVVPVESAAAMERALRAAYTKATVLVMAAAVADYRPAVAGNRKLKKSAASLRLDLVRTTDILSTLARDKGSRIVVGFAAETHDVTAAARRKLREKRLDLIVANDVTAAGAGFGSDTNVVRLLDAQGGDELLPILPKDEVADRILDWVVARRRERRGGARRRTTGARAARRRSRRGPRPSA